MKKSQNIKITSLDQEFPLIKWPSNNQNIYDENRLFDFSYAVFFFFFLTGLKNYMVDEFDLVTF